MLNVNSIRRLNDQRLRALKTSLYGKRGILMCHCCGIVDSIHKPRYDLLTKNIATISRIQMERKNG